jgi:hypothetical protein
MYGGIDVHAVNGAEGQCCILVEGLVCVFGMHTNKHGMYVNRCVADVDVF